MNQDLGALVDADLDEVTVVCRFQRAEGD